MRWTRSGFVALLAIVGSVAAGCETETEGLGDGAGGTGGAGGSGGSSVTGTGGAHPVSDASAEADASQGGGDGAAVDASGDTSLDVTADGASDVSADVTPGVDAVVGGDGEAGTDAALGADVGDAPAETALSSDANDGGVDAVSSDAAGDAGDAAGPSPKVCSIQCAGNSDCPVGFDHNLCNTGTHHCATCLSDATCIAQKSTWAPVPCTADANCAIAPGLSFGDYCVAVDGSGRCAFDASKVGTPDCAGADDTYAIKKFATDDIVMVCADVSETCDTARGTCVSACSTGCTPAQGGNVCNATNGHCECASNADCGGTAPICNLDLHQCECGTVADCSGADSGRTVVCE